jgi:spermidine synthase
MSPRAPISPPQRPRGGAPALFGVALAALFALSGGTALVYQVMWLRSFGLVFGSTTRSASVVLAAFFLGMALGNHVGGRLARGRRAALRAYGLAELAVAAGAWLVLLWLDLYREAYPALYRSELLGPGGLRALQLLLAFAALAPPCVAMGATLPLMARAVVAGSLDLGRRVAAIYAVNTLGATAGALLSGFLLPVWLGTRGSVLAAVALNAGVGLAALALARGWRPQPGPPAAPPRAPAPRAAAPLLFVAAASGFGTLALEVLYTRLLVNALDASVFSFALVLATFLVALALGSALASLLVERVGSPWQLVAWAAAPAAAAIALSPAAFSRLWQADAADAALAGSLAREAGLAALVMAPAALLAGVVLPACWRVLAREAAAAGRSIGDLTSVNTLAAVAGSLAAGFVLIPFAGAGAGFALIAALYAGVAVVAVAEASAARARAAAVAACLAGAALLASGLFRVVPLRLAEGEEIVSFHEGESGNVAVTRTGDVLSLRLDDSYVLGTSRGARVHRSQGRLGLRLHGAPRQVAFIGLATGMSLSAIRGFPSVERAVAMELVPGVREAARAFDEANLGILDDPRVEVLVADGRNHLYGSAERYDVVVGDLFVPWHRGTGYLYSAEHFRIVKQRLREGGLFVQWLQLNQLSLAELRSVVGTFADVFEDAELWLHRVQERRPLVALVGRATPRPAEARARDVARLAGIERVCDGPALRRFAGDAPRNTDDRPVIEFSAARSHLSRTGADVLRSLAALEALRDG